jgi:hypothetical protein
MLRALELYAALSIGVMIGFFTAALLNMAHEDETESRR